ncbi:hypothetical protein HPB49_019635 [Dermacentor silvarum]|uniref:Uncharacterized protein n=1 Tax=Dermacentor silvarum TaxID=543639 RepID=A0ACB8CH15_DERSI|nr:hypothetical protein HPB49_019635 [Dermacentor silvarum]
MEPKCDMTSSAKKNIETSQHSNGAATVEPRHSETLPTEATIIATVGHTTTSKPITTEKSGAISGRKIRQHLKQNKTQLAQSPSGTPSMSLPSVGSACMSSNRTRLATIPGISETKTVVQQDAPSCAAESIGTLVAGLPRKPEVVPGPSTRSNTASPAGPTKSSRYPGSNSVASQVSDIYEALSRLSPSPEKHLKRKESKPFGSLLSARTEPFTNNVESPQSPSIRKSRVSFEMKAVMTILFIMIILSSVLLLYPKRKQQVLIICTTEGCDKHRYRLEHQLDNRVDPCDDFGGHVCRRWTPHKDFYLSRSEMSDMFLSWLQKLPVTLAKGADHFPVGKKIEAMFESCTTQTWSQLGRMKEFMRARGIDWPKNPQELVPPAKVLFDLSFNWNVHLWFTLKMLSAIPKEKPRRIFLAPNEHMLFWKAKINGIPKMYFQSVYDDLFKLFTNDTRTPPDVQQMLDYI